MPKNKQSKKKALARRRGRAPRPGPISECAYKYLYALGSPFDPRAIGACVPMSAGYSFKFTTKTRGIFQSGATGLAGVKFKPCASNDGTAVWYTDGTDAIASWPAAYTSTQSGVSGAASIGSPFAGSAFGAQSLQQRFVGGALRVRSVGSALKRGGVLYVWCCPDGGQTSANLQNNVPSYASARHHDAAAREWVEVPLTIDRTHVTEYAANEYAYGYSSGGTAAAFAFITPTDHTDNLFEFETVAHWEVIGSDAGYLMTKSTADVQGAEQAINAADSSSSSDWTFSGALREFANSMINLNRGLGAAYETARGLSTIYNQGAGGLNRLRLEL